MNGEDAGFLYMDLPGQPMNSMAVGILDPATDGPVTLGDVRRHLASRLDQLPSFRWRVVKVPLRLHHPVYVPDPDFDLDFHLRTATVSAPGGDAELDQLFASIAERHLDRRHPLWQVTLVNGLSGGRQALIAKYQHCMADGVAALTTFERIYSDAPLPPLPGVGPWAPEPLPGKAALVGGALRDHARSALRVPRLIRTTRRGASAVKERQASAEVEVPGFSGQAPKCAFNDAYSPGRVYTRAALPLSGVKAVKEAAGVTVNDTVLAILAGACRRYLELHHELPARPLLTSVPVSTEPAGAPVRQSGNHFWSFTTTLATDVDDPVERLRIISATAHEARLQLDLLGAELMPAWLDVVPPLLAQPGAKALVERLRAAADDVDGNILISNIRGPAEPWTLFGRTVRHLYVDGPPSNGVGINVMLWSYGDRLLFGILSFADALRHPDTFRQAISESYDELAAAVAVAGVADPAPVGSTVS
jgi:diacylglycerol O-acyltransferase